MGLKEHVVFLEIDYDKTETVWGMDIIINTSAKTDEEAKALLEGFQFPFTRTKGDTTMAKTEPDQPEQEARKAGRAVCRQARRAEGDGRRHEGPRRRSALPRG